LDGTLSLRALNILKKSGFVPGLLKLGMRPQRIPTKAKGLSPLSSPSGDFNLTTPTLAPGLAFSEGEYASLNFADLMSCLRMNKQTRTRT
jgi:hypothetical protein